VTGRERTIWKLFDHTMYAHSLVLSVNALLADFVFHEKELSIHDSETFCHTTHVRTYTDFYFLIIKYISDPFIAITI
jgi:hypothetical protein